MDLIARTERLPRPGETVHGLGFATLPGGKGANQAVAAARLGANTVMIGRVGDDAFAPQLIAALRSAGVDTAHVLPTNGRASGVALIGVAASGENAIIVAPGANGDLSTADIVPREHLIAAADALLVQLEVPGAAVEAALHAARRHGVRTLLDAAPAPRGSAPSWLFDVDVLSPNQSEAEALTGLVVRDFDSAAQAAQRLLERGARSVALKMGALGAYYAEQAGKTFCVTARAVSAVDTTAAGDAFTAALAVGLAEGRPVREALVFACDAGALATTRLGAQAAMPMRAEVDALPPRTA